MSTLEETAEDLAYLTYVSTAVARFNQSDLKQLLDISRRNNASRGITGLLLYRDGRFLQYLEGPLETVQSTFEHIKLDERHDSAQVVGTGPLEGRIFPEWRMAYRKMTTVKAAHAEGYSECMQPNFQPPPEGDPAEMFTKLFHELW